MPEVPPVVAAHRPASEHVPILGVAGVVLFIVALLTGCTPTWRDTVETAGVVGNQIACAICQRPVPAPPAVDPEKQMREDAVRMAAWAATMIAILQDVVQRGSFEVLAGQPVPAVVRPAEVKP